MSTVRYLSDHACDTMEAQSEGCANTPRTLTRTPEKEVNMATRHSTHNRTTPPTTRRKRGTGWWKHRGFKTKDAAKAYVREIVNRQTIGVPLDGDDLDAILDILSHHSSWEHKRGSGIAAVTVEWNSGQGRWPTKGIWITRTDGSTVDISWTNCFDGASHEIDCRLAARDEVDDQRRKALKSAGPTCSICEAPLSGNLHVDHAPPREFRKLFGEWLEDRQISTDQIELVEVGPQHNLFVDRELAAHWAAYHRANAILRVVHKRCNLTQARPDMRTVAA